MNAAQLRALGFDEAADAADAAQWEGERARVMVEHQRKSPSDARLAARVVARLEAEEKHEGWITAQVVTVDEVGPLVVAKMDAFYESQSDGLPDGIVEHDDAQAGAWK